MALTISVEDIISTTNNPLLQTKPHWTRVRLGDVATVLNGYAFKAELFNRTEGTPLIRIRDVGSDDSETLYSGEFETKYLVQSGELLIGMDGDFNCARWRGKPSLLNQRVCKVSISTDAYEDRFLDFVLPGYLKAINDATSSITVKHLSSRTIQEIPLPCPPIDEQREIVAELEKQFSRLDQAVANLQRVKANLKRYKASVLKDAVEGRLVPTEAELARREGRGFETGEQLLQRILETRRCQWKGKGKFEAAVSPEIDELHVLPDGWTWCATDQVCEKITDGEHISPSIVSDGVPLLSAKDVLDAGVTFGDAKYVTSSDAEKFRSRCDPDRGDILIVSRGATIGRACRVNSDRVFSLMGSVILMKPSKLVEAGYLMLALKAGFFLTRLTAVSGSTAQQAIYIRDVRPLQLPLPPIAEQQRIAVEVDRLFSIIFSIEAEVNRNLARAVQLRHAVLKQSFVR